MRDDTGRRISKRVGALLASGPLRVAGAKRERPRREPVMDDRRMCAWQGKDIGQ